MLTVLGGLAEFERDILHIWTGGEGRERAEKPALTTQYYKFGIQRIPLAFEKLNVPMVAMIPGEGAVMKHSVNGDASHDGKGSTSGRIDDVAALCLTRYVIRGIALGLDGKISVWRSVPVCGGRVSLSVGCWGYRDDGRSPAAS